MPAETWDPEESERGKRGEKAGRAPPVFGSEVRTFLAGCCSSDLASAATSENRLNGLNKANELNFVCNLSLRGTFLSQLSFCLAACRLLQQGELRNRRTRKKSGEYYWLGLGL